MVLAKALIDALLDEAAKAHPRECCGILLGDGGTVKRAVFAANVHPQPETHFEIDPRALIDCHREARAGGMQVLGYYHSHPNGLARPSGTDRKQAHGDGKIWAIVAGNAVSLWRDAAGGFQPLSYSVEQG